MVIYSRMLTRFYCCVGFLFYLGFFLVRLRVVQIGLQYGGMAGINLGLNRVSFVCNWLKWGRPWIWASVRSVQRLFFLRI